MVQEVIITNSNRNPLDFRLTTLEQIEHFAALVAERDTALLRQALEAVEERYVGALRDKAITALRERLEGKE
jgi:hypothetical protein